MEWILRDGGSRDWRLNPDRARLCEFLVCTQNCNNTDFGAPTAPHGAAFLIGHRSDIIRSWERPDRWHIGISDFIVCDIPNIWAKLGHRRYPVAYATLEEVDIDLSALPPFRPLPLGGAGGMSERRAATLIEPANFIRSERTVKPTGDRSVRQQPTGGQDAWRQLDAILDQLDRIPDLPTALDPLDWDEHGLPR